jgi:hypothetical protein
MYANLPDKQRKSLAEATGKRSAACSANQLYKMLGNPDIVAELPRDEFKGRINKSGKIKLWTRITLAIRHFYYALFSQFQKLGKAFADLIPKKGAAKEKSSSQKSSTKATGSNAKRQPSTSRNSNWTKDLAANVGISAAGNIIGNVGGNLIAHKLDKKHPEQASDKTEASGSDADLPDLDKKHPATSKDEPSTAEGSESTNESSEKSKHQERSEDSDSVDDGDADSAHHEDVGDSKTHHSDKSHSHDTDDKHGGDEDSDTDAEDSDSDAGDADDDGGGGWWSRIFGHHGSSDDDYDFD